MLKKLLLGLLLLAALAYASRSELNQSLSQIYSQIYENVSFLKDNSIICGYYNTTSICLVRFGNATRLEFSVEGDLSVIPLTCNETLYFINSTENSTIYFLEGNYCSYYLFLNSTKKPMFLTEDFNVTMLEGRTAISFLSLLRYFSSFYFYYFLGTEPTFTYVLYNETPGIRTSAMLRIEMGNETIAMPVDMSFIEAILANNETNIGDFTLKLTPEEKIAVYRGSDFLGNFVLAARVIPTRVPKLEEMNVELAMRSAWLSALLDYYYDYLTENATLEPALSFHVDGKEINLTPSEVSHLEQGRPIARGDLVLFKVGEEFYLLNQSEFSQVDVRSLLPSFSEVEKDPEASSFYFAILLEDALEKREAKYLEELVESNWSFDEARNSVTHFAVAPDNNTRTPFFVVEGSQPTSLNNLSLSVREEGNNYVFSISSIGDFLVPKAALNWCNENPIWCMDVAGIAFITTHFTVTYYAYKIKPIPGKEPAEAVMELLPSRENFVTFTNTVATDIRTALSYVRLNLMDRKIKDLVMEYLETGDPNVFEELVRLITERQKLGYRIAEKYLDATSVKLGSYLFDTFGQTKGMVETYIEDALRALYEGDYDGYVKYLEKARKYVNQWLTEEIGYTAGERYRIVLGYLVDRVRSLTNKFPNLGKLRINFVSPSSKKLLDFLDFRKKLKSVVEGVSILDDDSVRISIIKTLDDMLKEGVSAETITIKKFLTEYTLELTLVTKDGKPFLRVDVWKKPPLKGYIELVDSRTFHLGPLENVFTTKISKTSYQLDLELSAQLDNLLIRVKGVFDRLGKHPTELSSSEFIQVFLKKLAENPEIIGKFDLSRPRLLFILKGDEISVQRFKSIFSKLSAQFPLQDAFVVFDGDFQDFLEVLYKVFGRENVGLERYASRIIVKIRDVGEFMTLSPEATRHGVIKAGILSSLFTEGFDATFVIRSDIRKLADLKEYFDLGLKTNLLFALNHYAEEPLTQLFHNRLRTFGRFVGESRAWLFDGDDMLLSLLLARDSSLPGILPYVERLEEELEGFAETGKVDRKLIEDLLESIRARDETSYVKLKSLVDEVVGSGVKFQPFRAVVRDKQGELVVSREFPTSVVDEIEDAFEESKLGKVKRYLELLKTKIEDFLTENLDDWSKLRRLLDVFKDAGSKVSELREKLTELYRFRDSAAKVEELIEDIKQLVEDLGTKIKDSRLFRLLKREASEEPMDWICMSLLQEQDGCVRAL